MQESEHVLAARRHADRAQSGDGGADPAVLASLAQAEALLAVAAAIDRLATVLSGPEMPAPSPEDGPAYQVEDIRRQHPNAYMPWIAEDDAALLAAHRAGHAVATLADTFGRQPSAIRARLNRLGAEARAEEHTEATPGPGPDTHR